MQVVEKVVTVSEAVLNSPDDMWSLQAWASDRDGISVTVTNNPNGEWWVQAEGFGIPTVRATLGDIIHWNEGDRVFTVSSRGNS